MSVEYATTLDVLDAGSEAPASLSDVAQVVREWARIPQASLDDLETTSDNGSRVTTRLLDPGDPDMWAWRLSMEVANEDRTRELVDWTATVTVLEAVQTKVAVQVMRTARGERLRPLGTRAQPPRIVRELIDHPAFRVADGPAHLTSAPNSLAHARLDEFVSLLFEDARRLPVVGISQGASGFVVDPPQIATKLCGLAHVWIIPAEMTWNVSDAISPSMSVYNGAVRLWWAGMKPSDNRYEHPLWFPRVGSSRIATELVDAVRDTAETRFAEPREVTELEERIRRDHDAALKTELDELLEVATRPTEQPQSDTSERTRLEDSVRARIEIIEQDRDTALADLVASDQERERLTRENARLQSENYQLRARAGFWEGDASDGDVSELSPEDAFLREIQTEYETRFTDADREKFKLADMRIGRQFLATLDQADVPRSKVIQVCAEVASRRAHEIPGRQPHVLRASDAASASQRRRGSDGAKAWRCYLENNTAQAARLHWWAVDGAIEFASVGPHDHFEIPE